jgi:hypothetical protein
MENTTDQTTCRTVVPSAASLRDCGLAWLLTGIFLSGGCYDGQALVELARAEAMQARLEEIDLGTYHTSLPRDPHFAAVEIEFHIFGQVPRHRAPEIRQELELQRYRLRFAVITVARQANAEQFSEPDLSVLKERLKQAANEVLADEPIVAVGFQELRFVHR